MSKTLNLVERLLAMGRKLQGLGLYVEAMRLLTRLANLRDLPPEVAEETQQRLAEIQLHRRKFARARRHLAAVLTHQPQSAHYHHLMGGAIAADRECDPRRAIDYYRRCVELDPAHPGYLCDFGLTALQMGQSHEGLKALRRAFELAPDDPGIVSKVVEGLRDEGEMAEARLKLRTAQFRNPRDSRFQKLWNDFQFQVLWADQQEDQPKAMAEVNDEPTLLPFVRPEKPQTGRILRRDAAARPTAPHLPQPTRVADRKQA